MRSISASLPRLSGVEERSPLRRLGNADWLPVLAALLLGGIGWATVASATAEIGEGYAIRQGIWLIVGVIAGVLVFQLDYHKLVDLAPIFYGLCLVLLVLVLFVGEVRGGARSWLALGPVGGQPSELAKLATALALARYLGQIQRSFLGLRQILVACTLVAVPVVLVVLQRDLGSAAMFLPMLAGMLLVAGVRRQFLIVAAILAAAFAAGFWTWGMEDYQRARVLSFVQPEADPLGAGYQVLQSKIAVGSGQWIGRGYGQGTQSQLRFLPERHTDFIMAVLAEEWGFLGVAAVLLLYGLYFSSAAKVAGRSRDRTGLLMIIGLMSLVSFHVIYNTAMVVGLVPITGIPLPFLSYGGSFLLLNAIICGLVVNVDYRRYVNR